MLIYDLLPIKVFSATSGVFLDYNSKIEQNNTSILYLYINLGLFITTIIVLMIISTFNKPITSRGLLKLMILLVVLTIATFIAIFIKLDKMRKQQAKVIDMLADAEKAFAAAKESINKYSETIDFKELDKGKRFGPRLIWYKQKWYFDATGIKNNFEFVSEANKAVETIALAASSSKEIQPTDLRTLMETANFYLGSHGG